MSVRAHRVIKIETAGDSFSLSNETELRKFIILNSHNDIESKLDESGCGLFDVLTVVLKQAIGEIPKDFFDEDAGEKPEYANLGLDESVIDNIKEDIAFAEKNGDDYVTYYAY